MTAITTRESCSGTGHEFYLAVRRWLVVKAVLSVLGTY